MASVKYHGEFPEGKDSIEMYGYVFEGDKAVNVTDEDHLAKFSGNRFFEVSGKSDKEQTALGKEDAEKAELQSLQEWLTAKSVPFHHREGVDKLRAKKAEWLKADAKAQEA